MWSNEIIITIGQQQKKRQFRGKTNRIRESYEDRKSVHVYVLKFGRRTCEIKVQKEEEPNTPVLVQKKNTSSKERQTLQQEVLKTEN